MARRRGSDVTVLQVLRGTGALVPRQTSASRVHLVGTAAGPLGGDTLSMRVVVEAGAVLQVCSVAATLALPGRTGHAALTELSVQLGPDAVLEVCLEPLVVAAGAHVLARTDVQVAAGGRLTLREQVVLGRWREAPGRWSGTVEADLDGQAWLRQWSALGPGAPTWDDLQSARVMVTSLRSPGPTSHDSDGDASAGCAVRAALARGGTLTTAVGRDLGTVRRDADAVGTVG